MLLNNELGWRFYQVSGITVVVPCYNHSKFIEKCLTSIFAQTLHPKKLIVINDGSTDNSAEIIEKLLQECPFPYEFISRENRGLSASLNQGLDLAETEYFAYMASDDIWLPTFLENRFDKLQANPKAVLVFGYGYLIDTEDNILDSTKNWTEFPEGDLLPTLLEGRVFICHSVLFRSKFLKKYRWNEDSISEDYEMYLKLTTEGDFIKDDEILSGWRTHGSNISKNSIKIFDEMLKAQDRCRELLNLSEAELKAIQSRFKFNNVDHFVRTGNKREAISMFWDNLSFADSNLQIVKLLVRLSIPQSIFQWNLKRKKRNAIKKNGKLEY